MSDSWQEPLADRMAARQRCPMALQKHFNFGRAGGLFNQKTIRRALTKVRLDATAEQLKAAKDWAAQVRHPKFKAKETSVRPQFIQQVLVTVLGYKPYCPGETFTIASEECLGKGSVDTRARSIDHPAADGSTAGGAHAHRLGRFFARPPRPPCAP